MEPRICGVIKKHRSSYPKPLALKAGDKVTTGKIFTENSQWQNWRWCSSQDGREGWIPEQYLNISGQVGTILCDYSGNELDVDLDEQISVYKIVNGWAWAKNSAGEFGWVPLQNICF
jgi:hypothetical protein